MNETLYVGDTYEEKGASVPDGYTLYISGSVDTSTPGVYTITYRAVEIATGQNVTRTKTITVIEVPQTVPEVTLVGESVVTINLADALSYVDAGATSNTGYIYATGPAGTVDITTGNFTGIPEISGSYTIIYHTQTGGAYATRTIHVIDPDSGGTGGTGGTGETDTKPEIGYPIVSISTSSGGTDTKPEIGYPIESVSSAA